MEETLAPDIIINKTQMKIGNKTYTYYCKRKAKEDATFIKNDLTANGYDVVIRRAILDYHVYYTIWWRKDS